jgi:hypothetical protein
MTVQDDEPSVVIKKKHAPKKKVVVRKKKPSSKVVVHSRSRHVVEEPVSVRRRTVRTYEESEPSVSVRSRTTVRGGVNVEHRNSSVGVRQQSNESAVSNSSRQRIHTESTGSVSRASPSGEKSSGQSGARKMPMQGDSSDKSAPKQ